MKIPSSYNTMLIMQKQNNNNNIYIIRNKISQGVLVKIKQLKQPNDIIIIIIW